MGAGWARSQATVALFERCRQTVFLTYGNGDVDRLSVALGFDLDCPQARVTE